MLMRGWGIKIQVYSSEFFEVQIGQVPKGYNKISYCYYWFNIEPNQK